MVDSGSQNRLSRWYADWGIRLRWLILPAVAGAVVASVMLLPSVRTVGGGLSIAPNDSAAVQDQQRVLKLFGLPLLSRVVLVQHDPKGFPADTLQETFQQAGKSMSRPRTPGSRPPESPVRCRCRTRCRATGPRRRW